MFLRRDSVIRFFALWVCLWCGSFGYAQDAPSDAQLQQLLAPIALYPDPLLAQIVAASADPQQIVDADAWLKQNSNLQGQALTDAAQKQGFDPAFISLTTFPTVLDAMAKNIDDYAAIGAASKAIPRIGDRRHSDAAAGLRLRGARQQSISECRRSTARRSAGGDGAACQSAGRVCSDLSTRCCVRQQSECRNRAVDNLRHRNLRHHCWNHQSTVGMARLGLGMGRPWCLLSEQCVALQLSISKPASLLSPAAAGL